MKKLYIFSIFIIFALASYAYDIAVENDDGVTIYYNYSDDGKELVVTNSGDSNNRYYGNVVIPEEVVYMNRTRKVTSIDNNAFNDCFGLISVTIPNSVTTIKERAFSGCTSLKSVTIPNSVTTIKERAFSGCSSLTSITIPNSVTTIELCTFLGCSSLSTITIPNSITTIEGYAFSGCTSLKSVTIPYSVTTIKVYAFSGCSSLTSITIPNSVTSIGNSAFSGCSSLTSITIPNSVSSIEGYAFSGCTSLKSVTIPNSVTTIKERAFSGCSSLTSITIPNSVSSIEGYAFFGCSSLTSITIPNSVSSIEGYAFFGCSSLTSITIPNSVTSIGNNAFEGADIPTIITLIENPFPIARKTEDNRIFSRNTFNNATLYVPVGTIDIYKATEGWKDFFFIEEGTGGEEPPTPLQCAKPTISYKNGQLKFDCDTEGVKFKSSIKDNDIKEYSRDRIYLSATYSISVYATKVGYENSEVATATLCWIDVEPMQEGTIEAEDAVSEVKAIPVLIQAEGNTISVQGAAEGTEISAYNANGIKLSSTIANKGITTLNTQLPSGSTAIVKIGGKAVKVLVK